MKFCPKCGNELKGNQLNFCPECGAPLPKNDAENVVSKEQPELVKQPQRTTKNKGVKIVLIALILVLACGAGYFAFRKYQEDQQEKERNAQEQTLIEQKEKNQQEKERIAQEQVLAEQKEKEKREKKEQEEKKGLASKSNVKDTLIFGMYQNKYSTYSSLAGMQLTEAKDKYGLYQVEGRNYYKNDVVGEVDVSNNGKIKNFSIYFDEPISSEALLSSISTFPFMVGNKEEGYFSETGIISETGVKIQIYYYVDTNTLSIDHALIIAVE